MQPLSAVEQALERAFEHWLLGQAGIVLLLVGCVIWLARSNRAFQARNDALSDYLVRSIESHSSERVSTSEQHALQLASTAQGINDAFGRVLEKALSMPGRSSGRSEPGG